MGVVYEVTYYIFIATVKHRHMPTHAHMHTCTHAHMDMYVHKHVHMYTLQLLNQWFVLLVEIHPAREEWRSSITAHGELSVRVTGHCRMPM